MVYLLQLLYLGYDFDEIESMTWSIFKLSLEI